MDIKKVLISMAVFVLVEKTNLIRKPDPAEAFFANLFGIETEQDRVIRELIATTDKATEATKKLVIERKFKKIIRNMK